VIDQTHDPKADSWLASAKGHPEFPVQNLPLGVFSPANRKPRGGVAIGDRILDIAAVAPLLDGAAREAALLAGGAVLNPLLGAGREALRGLRHALFDLLTDEGREHEVQPHLHPAAECRLHLPVEIGDYTDFYAGIHHAVKVGSLFRPDNPLLPNYKYVPIGYHGRASSVTVSGREVARPNGQTKAPDAPEPSFGPSRRLDYELEMAIWVGAGNPLGEPVPIAEAADHIAGLSILNDWSARDIQAWEYQPLGPFLAKSFQTTVSPWIVTLDALAPYRTAQPSRADGDPKPLPYLFASDDQENGAFNLTMEVHLSTEKMRSDGEAPFRLSRGRMTSMYWTAAQLLAHHTSNGCNLRPGDLLGTGTLSGEGRESMGSLLELSDGGKQPIDLGNGETRTFLEDGDEVIITAFAEAKDFVRIGFGECRARIAPAR
jgi:fumarylacetoacetase